MKSNSPLLLLLFIAMLASGSASVGASEDNLARRFMVADTHIDVPYRLNNQWADVTEGTEEGDFDAPRARKGGLDVPFMSIYTPAELEQDGGSFQLANQLIDGVEALVARDPDGFVIVKTPDEASAARQSGRIALAMGMENGTPIEGDLERIRYFRDRGVSYITLAHSLANHIADSSYDEERPNGGLSDFGKRAIREMNRQGMMVDISHVSDEAFWQTLEISTSPLIASHSSARHFTPDFERNMSDEMIKALAAKGGVIMINYGSAFLTAEANAWSLQFWKEEAAWLEAEGLEDEAPEAKAFADEYRERNPYPFASLDDVLNHFDHVIALAGVTSVGIGSDYDGVGDSLPTDLKDVSSYPALADGLKGRGYSDEEVALMLGGNVMRVWSANVEAAH